MPNEAWTFPVLVWVVNWFLTQLPATLAYTFGTMRSVRYEYDSERYVADPGDKSGAYGAILAPLTGLAHQIVEPFRNWDGTWYYLVSTTGYNSGSANSAFWPLYPWLMEKGALVSGWSPETVGYIISRLAFLGALVFLYRLIRLDFSADITERSLWALALFPTAFFFTAIYTESLFLFFVAAALYYARRGEWLLAGLFGLLGALTRSAGVMILAPFAVLFIQQYGWRIRTWFPKAFAAALPAFGPVVFGWYLTTKDKGFFDWTEQQWQWNRFSATPWRTFDCLFNGCTANVRFVSGTEGEAYVRPIDWSWIGDLASNPAWSFVTSSGFRYRFGQSHVFELLVTVAAIVLVLVGLRKVPFFYTAFVVPPLIVPLITPSQVNPLMSMPRFILPLFPLFVVAAVLIRSQRTAVVLGVISSVLLIIFTMQFALWYWVA